MNVNTNWDWGTILGWLVVVGGVCIAIYKAVMYRYKRSVVKAFGSGQAAKDLDWIKATLIKVEKSCDKGAKQLFDLNTRTTRIETYLKLNGYGEKGCKKD